MRKRRARAKRAGTRAASGPPERGAAGRFVVHEHRAARLHYDFRLELGGVLKSWALPKGPSMNPVDKRLAVAVPDHPVNYGDYEGIIPAGTYGAGPVIIWDTGTWEPAEPGDPEEQLETGTLAFRLNGRKLRGGWVLARLARGRGKDWLLIKRKDAAADPSWRLTTDLTPRRLRQLVVKAPPCEAH
jgi:DNA ligase D-like protein (predicted 3'-phosphoesterase)